MESKVGRSEDGRIPKVYTQAVRGLFKQFGYRGRLLVVDDQLDEVVFLVPASALLTIRQQDLCIALQRLLGRKVWIVDASPIWVGQARPF
ncbi:MAG: hypothetical protein Q7S35_00220 [Candidatus Limnocylindrales bacterium]|nr:hypothetical protein [Candidatus Limnocylindrales bacterium]